MTYKEKFEPVPEFGQFVEFITQSEPIIGDGEIIYGIEINRVRIDTFLEGENPEQSLETVEQDYKKVATLRSYNEITPEEEQALSEKLHSDMVAYSTQDKSPLNVVSKLKEVVSCPGWKAGIAVKVGEVYGYEDNLYEVIQAHTTQADWTPPIAKALWKRYYEPSDDPWELVQPAGAHDAYPLGARVEYNGNIYESTIDANVWAPDVTGWKNLTAGESDTWAAGVAYSVGDEVTYNGNDYRCLQAHTSQAGWNPEAAPALWERI